MRANVQTPDELRVALREPHELTHLMCVGVDDEDLVGEIAQCVNLESLIVINCAVSKLVDRLDQFPKLDTLQLTRDGLTEFPQAMFALTELVSLTLYFDGAESPSMPAELVALAKLRVLRLSGLSVSSFPDGFFDVAWTDLVMIECELSILPDEIGRLQSLDQLVLRGNQLTTLPASIGQLRQLNRLDITSNPFVSLPAEIGPLSQAVGEFVIDEHDRKLMEQLPVQTAPGEMSFVMNASDPRYGDVAEILEAEGLPELMSKVRRTIRIRTDGPDDYSVLGSSRFGGFPDLMDPDDYPKAGGRPWSFLAQINLADTAELNDFLPRQGLLSFFIQSTEHRKAKVVFAPALDELQTVRVDPEELWPRDNYTATPQRLIFEPALELPIGFFPDAHPWVVKKYPWPEEVHRHSMNGYTFTQHESPQQQAANDLYGDAEDWVPLLKVGSDDGPKFMFWDAGNITFSIHKDALSRHDFSNIHYFLYSS